MITANNNYTKMQKAFFEKSADKMEKTNHFEHNSNPSYWNILLGDINDDDHSNAIALDFGCGAGRNVLNLLKLTNWSKVEGVDISQGNIDACYRLLKDKYDKSKYDFYVNSGTDVSVLESNKYDFIMSTITFQHICVHEIRISLMTDLYRTMKNDGIFSFQMGFGKVLHQKHVPYFGNKYDATSTNGDCDVVVEDEKQIITDLEKIGFKNIKYIVEKSFSDNNHENWIYVKAVK